MVGMTRSKLNLEMITCFSNPSGLDLQAGLYCADIFAKPRKIAEERPYQGIPYEYIVVFYMCFNLKYIYIYIYILYIWCC